MDRLSSDKGCLAPILVFIVNSCDKYFSKIKFWSTSARKEGVNNQPYPLVHAKLQIYLKKNCSKPTDLSDWKMIEK